MFKKINIDIVIKAINFFSMMLLMFFAILTVYNGINAALITEALIASPSVSNIISHQSLFSYFVALNVMTHSGEHIAIQIAIFRLFAMLINEIALLSIIIGLFLFKKALTYLHFDANANFVNLAVKETVSANGLKFNTDIHKSAGIGAKLMLFAFLFAVAFMFSGSAYAAIAKNTVYLTPNHLTVINTHSAIKRAVVDDSSALSVKVIGDSVLVTSTARKRIDTDIAIYTVNGRSKIYNLVVSSRAIKSSYPKIYLSPKRIAVIKEPAYVQNVFVDKTGNISAKIIGSNVIVTSQNNALVNTDIAVYMKGKPVVVYNLVSA